MQELPLYDAGGARERADAARNRERILAAAAELVGERGIEQVSMDDVARAACVGAGTLYRRFGGRAGLALALLEDQTRAFQDALIKGPPPLGPGAPAIERLKAFGDAYVDLLEPHAELIATALPAGSEGEGPMQFYAVHVTLLVREAAPHLKDPEFTAFTLLTSLAPRTHLHLRRRVGWPAERLREGWHGLVDAVCRPPAPG